MSKFSIRSLWFQESFLYRIPRFVYETGLSAGFIFELSRNSGKHFSSFTNCGKNLIRNMKMNAWIYVAKKKKNGKIKRIIRYEVWPRIVHGTRFSVRPSEFNHDASLQPTDRSLLQLRFQLLNTHNLSLFLFCRLF